MITLSPNEIVAVLLELEKNDTPTDALISARRKFLADYKRMTGKVPVTSHLEEIDRPEIENINSHQQSLIDGYFALDPEGRLLGYFKGMPVIHCYTSPVRLRTDRASRNVVAISREGSPINLPKNSWMDNFIPAEGVAYTEAVQVVDAWHARTLKTEETV